MQLSQIPAAIAAMERYAAQQGATDAVIYVRTSLGTHGVDPRDGSLYGGVIEFRAQVERKTGRSWQTLPADVRELYEVHHAVTVATAPELLDDDGCPLGADLVAHGEFVRGLAVVA